MAPGARDPKGRRKRRRDDEEGKTPPTTQNGSEDHTAESSKTARASDDSPPKACMLAYDAGSKETNAGRLRDENLAIDVGRAVLQQQREAAAPSATAGIPTSPTNKPAPSPPGLFASSLPGTFASSPATKLLAKYAPALAAVSATPQTTTTTAATPLKVSRTALSKTSATSSSGYSAALSSKAPLTPSKRPVSAETQSKELHEKVSESCQALTNLSAHQLGELLQLPAPPPYMPLYQWEAIKCTLVSHESPGQT